MVKQAFLVEMMLLMRIFDGGEVSSLGVGVAIIIDAVTSCSLANTMRIVFFGAIGCHNANISCCDVIWNFRVGNEDACVYSKRNLAVFAKALKQTTNFGL